MVHRINPAFRALRMVGIRSCFAALCVPLLLLAAPALQGQTTPPDFIPATMPPESERDSLIYSLVPDGRHGPSTFPRVRHPEVEYEAGAVLAWDRYHTVDVMYEWLRRWAARYPEIVELYQVGTSYEGRPIMQVTLTNRATGPATDKPAAYFEGGRHSGEITASESVLWLIQHLVEGYGNDPEITELLDRAAVYARPQNNPDGSNLYLHTAQTNRSSVRPIDQNRDGFTDNNPAVDLDADGAVLSMRWRDEDGDWEIDPRDPTGRAMIEVDEGTGSWSMSGEGSGNDGIGGLDLHRNYPENWRPMPGRDHTGRGYTQTGAGAYPLSEPETRSVVLFLLENPNVGVVNSMDTRVPMHLRPPSTSKGEDSMFPEDLELYLHMDSVGVSITGYPWAGDVFFDYATRGSRQTGNPLFGHGPDFGYFFYGSIWYGDELWDGGVVEDLNGDGEVDELDRLVWSDSITGGRAFKEWTTFQHPTLGEVEIGGWHPKFFSQNGPPEVLGKWAGNQALFNLYMAQSLPELAAEAPEVRRLESNPDSTTWEVRIPVRNDGFLPTALRQADLVKIVRPDRVVLQLAGLETSGAEPEARFVEPSGSTFELEGYLQGGERKEAVFQITTYGRTDRLRGTFTVLSTRGGVVTGSFDSGAGAG